VVEQAGLINQEGKMESVFMKALRSAQKADEAKEKRSEEALDKSLSSRVSDEQIKKVLELEEKKVRRAEIAAQTKISAHTIYNVIRRYSIDKDGKVVLNDRDHISQ
tara:strand:- start:53 stop:370 length:318 start_codon:yes stop_codon:yes gene_type:complete